MMFSEEVRLSHVGNNVHYVKTKLNEQVDVLKHERAKNFLAHHFENSISLLSPQPHAFKLQYYSTVVSKVLTLKKINSY